MHSHMSSAVIPKSPQSSAYALRSLAIQGSQSWGIQHLLSRLSVLLRLQFRGKLEPVQLTVILKPEDTIDTQPVAWQVLEIDSRNPIFEVTLPNERGFGDAQIEERRDSDSDTSTVTNIVTSPESYLARSHWLLWVRRGEGDELSFYWPMSYHPTGRHDYISIRNATGVSRKFTIGTYNSYDEPCFQPFVLTEEVRGGGDLEASHALLMQIYLTSGVKVGQLMTESMLVNPLLTPTEGIDVKSEKITLKVLYGGRTGISISIL